MAESTNMILEMSKLIVKQLIRNQSIELPELGTLAIELEPARLDAKNKKLLPPKRVIRFSSQGRGKSLIKIIVKSTECSQKQAEELYGRWLKKVRTERGVKIAGIGELIDKSFITESALSEVLNTTAEQRELATPRHSGSRWVVSIASAVAIVAIISFASVKIFKPMMERSIESSAPKVELAAEPTPIVEQVVEVKAEQVKDETIANPAAKQEQAEPIVMAASPMELRYRVVFGVFAKESNAKHATEQILGIEGAVARIYPHEGNYMVSMFESSSFRECVNYMKLHNEEYPSIWIYERK
ncbi:MAG: hypothetical protein SNH88_02455 [Rikenellaceae bacterium]